MNTHMTGPEHYREAERLIALAESLDWQVEGSHEQATFAARATGVARVHAELAHTAALIDIAHSRGDLSGKRTGPAWLEAIS